MRRSKAALIALIPISLLLGCVTATREGTHVARPGYACTVGRSFTDRVWADATLDEHGAQVGGSWGWRDPNFAARLKFMVTSRSSPGAVLAVEEGFARLNWLKPLDQRRQNKLARLELTTNPDADYLQHGPFSGGFTRINEPGLYTNWGDLLAFARGSSKLWGVVRDRQGVIVDRVEVDPSRIVDGEKEVRRILGQLAELTSDFRNRCEHVDDIDPGPIIIT